MTQYRIGGDDQIYRLFENLDEQGNRVEDDYGFWELVPSEELLKALQAVECIKKCLGDK